MKWSLLELYLKVWFWAILQIIWKALFFLFIFLVMCVRDWRNVCKKVRRKINVISHEMEMKIYKRITWESANNAYNHFDLKKNNSGIGVYFIALEIFWRIFSSFFIKKKQLQELKPFAAWILSSAIKMAEIFFCVEKPKSSYGTICLLHLQDSLHFRQTSSSCQTCETSSSPPTCPCLGRRYHYFVLLLCTKIDPQFHLPGGKNKV